MLRTFKHPLFKREISQVRWSVLLLTMAILLPILTIINHAYDGVHRWELESINILTGSPSDTLGWLVIPILIISQFYYTRKENVIGMLAALPYSRNEQLKHKYIAGAIGIFTAYFVGFLILTATYYSAGRPIMGPFSPIFYWFLVASLSSLFQYSFYFLVATTMGNSIFAGVSGILIFYAPFFVVLSIIFQVDVFTGYYIDIEPLYKVLVPQYFAFTSELYNKAVSFADIAPLLVGYTVASFGLFKASQHFYNRNDFEYNGNMCMFIWAENLFLAGFTLCFGLIGLDFAQIFEGGWLYPIAIIAGLVCFPIGYILSRKLLQLTGHQIKFKRA